MIPRDPEPSGPSVALRVTRIALGLVAAIALYVSMQSGWTPRTLFAGGDRGPLDVANPHANTTPTGLNSAERYHLREQRVLVDELARRHIGTGIQGGAIADLRVIQDLLDRGSLTPDQTYELQALGVVVGDVLAEQLGLEWVAIEDSYGRSRALAGGNQTTILFPVTMISRWVEVGVDVDVRARYEEARSQLRPPSP